MTPTVTAAPTRAMRPTPGATSPTVMLTTGSTHVAALATTAVGAVSTTMAVTTDGSRASRPSAQSASSKGTQRELTITLLAVGIAVTVLAMAVVKRRAIVQRNRARNAATTLNMTYAHAPDFSNPIPRYESGFPEGAPFVEVEEDREPDVQYYREAPGEDETTT